MFAKVLVFACAALGLAAGSSFVIPKESAQVFTFPESFSSGNTVEFVSSGASSGNTVSEVLVAPAPAPVVAAPVVSTPVVATPVVAVQPTDGPESSPLPVIQAPAVTLPAVEGPVITLASQPIPAIKVIAQRCICTKTVVKPQIIQRQVTVPKYQRYLKRTVTPVVENVSYKSSPITQGSTSGPSIVIPGSAPQASSTTTVVATAPVATAQVVEATPVVAAPVVAAPVATSRAVVVEEPTQKYC